MPNPTSVQNILQCLSTLPGSPHLKEATAEDLRVLICLCVHGFALPVAKLAKLAGCSQARAKGALAFWQDIGLDETALASSPSGAHPTSDTTPTTDTPSSSTAKRPVASAKALAPREEGENATYIKTHNLGALIDECQQIMGWLFSPTEIAVVVGLSEQLQLDDTYILALMSYCAKHKKCSLKYVERMAFGLFDQHIDTPEALDDYFKKLEATTSLEGQLRKLFGMGDRAFSHNEQATFTRWICDYGYGMDVIGLAYDITVDTKQKAIVRYTDSILTHWHSEGCKTIDDVNALLEKERATRTTTPDTRRTSGKSKPTRTDTEGSFSTDDFFARALERSYGKKK